MTPRTGACRQNARIREHSERTTWDDAERRKADDECERLRGLLAARLQRHAADSDAAMRALCLKRDAATLALAARARQMRAALEAR